MIRRLPTVSMSFCAETDGYVSRCRCGWEHSIPMRAIAEMDNFGTHMLMREFEDAAFQHHYAHLFDPLGALVTQRYMGEAVTLP